MGSRSFGARDEQANSVAVEGDPSRGVGREDVDDFPAERHQPIDGLVDVGGRDLDDGI